MKNYLIGVGVIAVLVLLMGWNTFFGEAKQAFWADTQIACLPNGHANLALHQHSDLVITVNGVAELIPPTIGVSSTCMSEVHTHDTTGKVHVEARDAHVTHTLADFFAVWGQPIERTGLTISMKVDGAPSTEMGALVLKDGQKIELAYVSTLTGN